MPGWSGSPRGSSTSTPRTSPIAHSEAERGKVTGTPVGCACGEGVLDWARIIEIVQQKCPRDIVFSVECGTPEQAAKSLEHLSRLVGGPGLKGGEPPVCPGARA